MDLGTEEENSFGQMDPSMRVIGFKTKLMVMEDSYIQMVICMKGNGSMIRLTDMEYIVIKMVHSTRENGLKINNTEMDLKSGQMDLCLKEPITME